MGSYYCFLFPSSCKEIKAFVNYTAVGSRGINDAHLSETADYILKLCRYYKMASKNKTG